MRKWIVPLTIVCLITGFLLAFQLKALTDASSVNPMSQKNNNLISIIQNLEQEITGQENQVEKIRQELDTLQQNQQAPGKLNEMQEQLRDMRLWAGLTPVVGNGVIITVDDNKEGLKAKPNDDPNRYIVHYEHILSLVSELKRGGAEAISVNGQRLITTSEIRCVGNVILVNTTRIAPPFEIRAIGSPHNLAEMVTNGELEVMKATNYPISFQAENEVIIPAYKGELQFDLSQVAKED